MIKLFEIEPSSTGIRRFQTQLSIGKDHADCILKDGTMHAWGRGSKGFAFYPYREPYQIVKDIAEMKYQPL